MIIQKTIDFVFSYPRISNFFRGLLENRFRTTIKTIKKELDCSKNTLDIGCGTGNFSTLFQNYVGIDISKKYLSYASKKYSKEFLFMDATKLEFKDNSFDNALVVGMLHHLNNEKFIKVSSEIKRVLKKDGKALIFEDIPVTSSSNVLGKMIHSFDSGGMIRKKEDYERMLAKYLKLDNSYKIRSGVCDYAVFVMSK